MNRLMLPFITVSLVVALIGAGAASLRSEWDLVTAFVVVAGLQAVALVNASGDRVPMSLRPDLARWASQRSQRTGEPLNDVLDRSVAWVQHSLYDAGEHDGD